MTSVRSSAFTGQKEQIMSVRTIGAAAAMVGLVTSTAFAQGGGVDLTKAKLKNPASLTEKAPDTYKSKFDTSKGAFIIQVHRDWAPLGADRFYNL
jgi:hypothetical protein